MASISTRIKTAWNAFVSNETPAFGYSVAAGPSSSSRPHQPRLRYSSDRSIVSSVYMRIAIDVAAVGIKHIKLDENNSFSDELDSGLNSCLTLEPNMDQAPRAFRQDICSTLFDQGVAVIVPVDRSDTPNPDTNRDEILSLRVGHVVQWHPKHVKVSLYNEAKGYREEITLEKRLVAIVENPLYAVMNEPNSTLQRLIRKLNLLDQVDEQAGSGKLDMIIQLPYVIKSEARRLQAEQRRTDIEMQLKGSQYGIAYTDGTEKITQLNRPVENNLLKTVEYLTNLLYSQLGITAEVMNGTADEATMLNYFARTIEPILDAIVEAMQRSFLGANGTYDKERVKYFRDPFKLVPISQIADIADKFTRNEIFTSNEIRGIMGFAPSKDPKANQLINSNMPQPPPAEPPVSPAPAIAEMDALMTEMMDGLSAEVSKIIGGK